VTRAWRTGSAIINVAFKERLDYYRLKQHKPCLNKGCSGLLDQRIQAKLQWLQAPNQRSGDSPNKARREPSRDFRNKRREYLKDNVNEFTTCSKKRNISGLRRSVNTQA
jgi:hypothetical protein